MGFDSDTKAGFRAVALQALQAWAVIYARPEHASRQREYAQALAWTRAASSVLSGRGTGRFHFQTIQVTARSDPDQEFAESSRCWRLELDGNHVRLRRWRNHATLMGASQTGEHDATGDASDAVPPELSDWWPSLQAALTAVDALHQAGAKDVDVPPDEPARESTPEPPVHHNPAAPRTDWRGLGLLALLIVVAGPMKLIVSVSDGARYAWGRLRRRW